MEYDTAAEATRRLEERLVKSPGGKTGVSRRTLLGGLGIAGGAALGFTSPGASATRVRGVAPNAR